MTRDELRTMVEHRFADGGTAWGGIWEGDLPVLVLTDGTRTLVIEGERALAEWDAAAQIADAHGEYYSRADQDRANRYVASVVAGERAISQH